MKYKISRKFAYLKHLKKKGRCERCGSITNAKYKYCEQCSKFIKEFGNIPYMSTHGKIQYGKVPYTPHIMQETRLKTEEIKWKLIKYIKEIALNL